MGADKNSSRRMNSPYSPNSQSRVPTRVCQGCVVTILATNPRNKPQIKATRKRNSRSKGLRHSAELQADSPRWSGGRSTWGRWTVREVTADGLKKPTKPLVPHPEKWTVCALSSDGLRATCAARKVRDLEADSRRNLSQPKTLAPTDRTTNAHEQATNCTNLGPRGLSAPTKRTVRQVRTDTRTTGREQECEPPTTYPSMDLPNGLSSLGTIFGRCDYVKRT
jgi:hypothetical protein